MPYYGMGLDDELFDDEGQDSSTQSLNSLLDELNSKYFNDLFKGITNIEKRDIAEFFSYYVGLNNMESLLVTRRDHDIDPSVSYLGAIANDVAYSMIRIAAPYTIRNSSRGNDIKREYVKLDQLCDEANRIDPEELEKSDLELLNQILVVLSKQDVSLRLLERNKQWMFNWYCIEGDKAEEDSLPLSRSASITGVRDTIDHLVTIDSDEDHIYSVNHAKKRHEMLVQYFHNLNVYLKKNNKKESQRIIGCLFDLMKRTDLRQGQMVYNIPINNVQIYDSIVDSVKMGLDLEEKGNGGNHSQINNHHRQIRLGRLEKWYEELKSNPGVLHRLQKELYRV